MNSEIKPVFYFDGTTLRCRTMDDISDESVLYYRRGEKVHETDVPLYPTAALEALQAENTAQAKRIEELEYNLSETHSALCLTEKYLGSDRYKSNSAVLSSQKGTE